MLSVQRTYPLPTRYLTAFSLLGLRAFHSSRLLSQNSKTIQDWRLEVDWAHQSKRPYVVIDPNDPSGLLYMSSKEYLALVKTCLSTGDELVIVARPGDHAPTPEEVRLSRGSSSKTSSSNYGPKAPPRKGGIGYIERLARRFANSMRSRIPSSRFMKVREGMVEVTCRNIRKIHLLWFMHLNHILGKPYKKQALIHECMRFSTQARELLRTRGLKELIIRYKTALYVVMAFLAGEPVKNTEQFGIRLKLSNGLPVLLSRSVRTAIRDRSHNKIRLWTSVFGMYKGFKGPYDKVISTATIRYPAYTGDMDVYREFLPLFFKQFFAPGVKSIKDELTSLTSSFTSAVKGMALPFMLSASPNSKVSHFGIGLDSIAWYAQTVMSNPIMRVLPEKEEGTFRVEIMLQSPLYKWAIELHNLQFLIDFQHTLLEYLHKYLPLEGKKIIDTAKGKKEIEFKSELILGRLSTKFEPAGKVRLFALVDWWTQRAFRPLHDWVFGRLKQLDTDGTFDQEGATDYLQQWSEDKTYSFDLKSATDLIPIQLYEECLTYMLGKKASLAWKGLMQDRVFVTPQDCDFPRVQYTRGQPMGALSSWAMLALVHHSVVQFGSYMSKLYTGERYKPYRKYAIVGDDITIKGQDVADAYLTMCKCFDIKVGLYKSLPSVNDSFSFVNRFISDKQDLSPISLRDELTIKDLPARYEAVVRMVRRGWIKQDFMSVLKAFLSPQAWEYCSSNLSVGKTPILVIKALRAALSPGPLMEIIVPKGHVLPILLGAKPVDGMVTTVVQLITGKLSPTINSLQYLGWCIHFIQKIERTLKERQDALDSIREQMHQIKLPGMSPRENEMSRRMISYQLDSRRAAIGSSRYNMIQKTLTLRHLQNKSAGTLEQWGLSTSMPSDLLEDMFAQIAQVEVFWAIKELLKYPPNSAKAVEELFFQKPDARKALSLERRSFSMIQRATRELKLLGSDIVDFPMDQRKVSWSTTTIPHLCRVWQDG